ncbi:MAG: L-serine ammonia-lyase, iron-sulfur-dependent, subunit alpha, partial [Clostridia bacterium]|nr:L-serine ammonia-lyase, iron-sulfur-dependent, subunit alpha [Clostridia bacterium]
AGAGICHLDGGTENDIAHTIVNALAIISGVVCDGAKSSCAAKIASSVEAGMLGYYMHKEGDQFIGGEGIVKKGVENTIKAVGTLARVGMCETDKEILHIMMD